ncbi:unnamed protein product, partial [Amoebophrya sp. A25]|eukprot:GSA25T00010872001.1
MSLLSDSWLSELLFPSSLSLGSGTTTVVPPSAYVTSRRPHLITVLAVQTTSSAFRVIGSGAYVAEASDPLGSLFLLIGVCLGWYAVWRHLQLEYI